MAPERNCGRDNGYGIKILEETSNFTEMVMADTGYFFRPWKGAQYEKGWKGLRTLVVGVAHICTLSCPHHVKCGNPGTVKDMDRRCPVYDGKDEYYSLSNSNDIEIQSFIDGEARYPAYSAFTYYMTKKRDTLPSETKAEFWNSVAFTNFLQYFLDNDELDGLEKVPVQTISGAFHAFCQVCEGLKPQVIFAWNPKVCEWLKSQAGTFRYLGQADMAFQLSVYVFAPASGGVEGNNLRKLRYDLGIKSEFHRSGWYKDLVDKYLGQYIRTGNGGGNSYISYKNNVKGIAETLEECVKDGTLGSSGDCLYFRNSDRYKWTTTHIGWFIKMLKISYGLEQGSNDALARMFNEYGMTKYSSDITRIREDDNLLSTLKGLF